MGKLIGLCHRNLLFSECLAAALNKSGELACSIFQAEFVVASMSSIIPLEMIVLDVMLGDDLVSRVADAVRRYQPACKLLLLVADPVARRMSELSRLDSQGWLSEDVSLTTVQVAIETVLSGRRFCSPELAVALMSQLGGIDLDKSWSKHLDDVQLTSREREVLELIALENLSNKQIAKRLSVSLYTVKNHVHNIIEKLGVVDRYGAVQLARRRKLLLGSRTEVAEFPSIPVSR